MAFITCLFSVSCGISRNSSKDGDVPDPHSGSIESYDYEIEQTGELLSKLVTYFDSQDKESIKALFAPQTRQDYNLDSQIDKVLEIYDGKSVSYNIDKGEIASKKVIDDVYVYLAFYGKLDSVKLDNNKMFCIQIERCAVNDDNKSMIGLNKITLCNEDGTRLAPIGEFGEEKYFS